MRRLILEEPVSHVAIWSRRLALFALALALFGVVLARNATIEISAALAVFGSSILIACTALLFAAAGAVVIWRTGRRGVLAIIVASLLALGFLAWPAWLGLTAVRLPLLNDVSTDINEPPQFSQSEEARSARASKQFAAVSEFVRLEQQRAYPDVQPIIIDLEAEEVYELALEAARSLGWTIIEQNEPLEEKIITPERPPAPKPVFVTRGGKRVRVVPPRPPAPKAYKQEARDGRIEAYARTPVMGFPDDITIRIRALPDQARVDIRSASRYGRHDFGANAKRIRQFAAALQEQLDSE